jgi:hypothetical protein
MSIIVLLCLLFGVAALLLLVLFFLQRRQLKALDARHSFGDGTEPPHHPPLEQERPEKDHRGGVHDEEENKRGED